MATESSSFKIFVRKVGEDPQEVFVTPTTTVAEIKAQKGLKGYVLCFKGHRKVADTMSTLGIQAGDTISAINTSHSGEYQAAQRLKRGKEKGGSAFSRAYTHLNMHEQTRATVVAAVMDESQKTRNDIAGMHEDLKTLAAAQSANPAPHPTPCTGELEAMVLVLDKFRVGRMNQILEQFAIQRPRGLTCKAKAKLIVEQVPRLELMKLLNEATLPPPPAPDGEAAEPPAKCSRLQAPDSPTRADLEKKSMRELREMLKERFIKVRSHSKKPLIDALLAQKGTDSTTASGSCGAAKEMEEFWSEIFNQTATLEAKGKKGDTAAPAPAGAGSSTAREEA